MKRFKQISIFLSILMVLNILFSAGTLSAFARDGKSVSVIIHYNRPDGNYDKWNIWSWFPNLNGNAYQFNKEDSYGKIAEFTIDNPNGDSKVGFIVRKGEWEAKDVEADRFADVKDGKAEFWLQSGEPTVYYSESDAKSAVVPKIKSGSIEGLNTAVLKTNLPFKLTGSGNEGIIIKSSSNELNITSVKNKNVKTTEELGYEVVGDKIHFVLVPGRMDVPKLDANGESKVFIAGGINGWNSKGAEGWQLSWNADKKYYELTKDFSKDINFGDEFKFINIVNGETNWMNGANLKVIDQSITDTVLITTKESFEIGRKYIITKDGYKGDSNLAIGDSFYTSKEFNDKYYYSGNDLGYTYSKNSTKFRVWAPFAEKMSLVTYKSGDMASKEKGKAYAMKKDVKGTWTVTIKGDLNGMFYTYRVKNAGDSEKETGDPYARAVGINGDRSAVVDFSKVNPKSWSNDKRPALKNMTDAVIYELHIRDLAMNKDSGIKNKGKFLEFTENTPNGKDGITRGVNHLKDLGVNVVHLLPSFDYASIDEKTLNKNAFNWGYDPKNYNVPEGSYSTNPSKPEVRITEYKEMVQALHKNGIRVVMDVVYNHTNDNITSKFSILVPGYYYRMNEDGTFKNGTGCGSETASERAMMRKYIVDSVKYWVKEYHVDGFRFDLMGIHDIDTMNQVRSELSKIDPSIIVYGEGWDMGNLPRESRAIQPYANKMDGIGFFNDNIRDNLKGSWNDKESHGFVDGKQNMELEIMEGVVGSIQYNQIVKDYNDQPGQSINYVEAHDNNTLWDKLSAANTSVSEADRIKMDTLSNAVVLTSQGVPFLAAGVDFLRTKNGDENSYQSPDSINSLDWARKAQYKDVFSYYKGLIELRKTHPAFRMPTSDMVRENLTFMKAPRNTVEYVLKNNANGDTWKNILVAYNANNTSQSIAIPSGNWNIVVKDGKSGVKTIEAYNKTEFSVSPLSTVVMYTNDDIKVNNLFEGVNIAKSAVNSNNIIVNGKETSADDKIIQDGETIFMPLVSVAKAVGAEVSSDPKTSNTIIKKGKDEIVISGDKVTLNGSVVSAQDKTQVKNSVMLVSSDTIETLLNVNVFADYRRYDDSTNRADDKSPDIYIVF